MILDRFVMFFSLKYESSMDNSMVMQQIQKLLSFSSLSCYGLWYKLSSFNMNEDSEANATQEHVKTH